MIIPLYDQQSFAPRRPAILPAQLGRHLRQRQHWESLLQLGALQPRLQIDDLHCCKVAVRAASCCIDRDQVLLTGYRRQPHQQSTTAPPLHRLVHRCHPLLDGSDIEAALSGCFEAALRVFGKLLRPQPPVAGLQPASKADLLCTQSMPCYQRVLLHRKFCNWIGYICFFQPPRKEVLHDPALF